MSELSYAYLLSAIAALLMGLVVIFIKLARSPGRLGIGISLATGTFAMFVLAGPDLALLTRLSYGDLALFFVIGTLEFTLGLTMYYESIRIGDVSVAVPITRLKVLPLLAFSVLLGLEAFKWTLLGACVLVVLGGALVGAPDSRPGAQDRAARRLSILLAIGACLCWAVAETLLGKLPKDLPAIPTNALLLGCALVSYLIYAAASGAWRSLLQMPGRGVWCYMAHGIVSLSTAFVLVVRAIQIAGPPRVNVITSAYPLISAMVGWVVFRERFSATIAVGAVLLIGGVILLQFV
jgi:drug/metabolite transporter (DMT)-like permease